jgi:hypothetical protein
VSFVVNAFKAITTKDTKDHEGIQDDGAISGAFLSISAVRSF